MSISEDAEAQDVLLCINTGQVSAPTQNRMKMEGDQFYPALVPSRCTLPCQGTKPTRSRGAQEIAEHGSIIDLELGKRYFPTFTPPSKLEHDIKSSEDLSA